MKGNYGWACYIEMLPVDENAFTHTHTPTHTHMNPSPTAFIKY